MKRNRNTNRNRNQNWTRNRKSRSHNRPMLEIALLTLGVFLAFPGSVFPNTERSISPTPDSDAVNHRTTTIADLFHGDTVLMEDVKTGKQRKVRLIFPDSTENKAILNTKTTVIAPGDTTDSIPNPQERGRRNSIHPQPDREQARSQAIFGLTFSRIDFGLTRPMQGGSFKLDGDSEFLSYKPAKTLNFGFDVFQIGRKFTPSFRVFLSAGFDWTYIRLKQGLQFDPERSPYMFSTALPEDFSKNKLTSTYLRIPLTFEVKGSRNMSPRIAVGPIAGVLLKGTQRYRLDNGKTSIKHRGYHGFTPFQYGVFARVGSKHLGLYGKYYFNDLFEHSPPGAELRNLTFGLTAAF